MPVPPVEGVSLAALMRGRARGLDLEAYAESEYPRRLGMSPLRAVRERRFKLIDAPRPELYDLTEDPLEERNLYEGRRALAAALAARAAVIARPGSLVSTRNVSPEVPPL